MDLTKTLNIWERYVPHDMKTVVGTMAFMAYALKQVHEGNVVLEKQTKLGPGATAESMRDWGQAEGRLVDAIRSALQHGEQELEAQAAKEQAAKDAAAAPGGGSGGATGGTGGMTGGGG